MASNKSIDGLAPKRRKPSAGTISPDGFTPLVQPRKTNHPQSSRSSSARSSSLDPNLIHPEEFIPPRKTSKNTNLKTPKISSPSQTQSTKTTKKSTKTTPTVEEINNNFLEPIKAFDFDEETGELMNTENPEKNDPKTKKSAQELQKPPKTKKKWSKKRKFWTWFSSILILLIIAAITIFIIWGNDLLARITGGRGNIADLFESYAPLEEDVNGRTNILAFGTSGFDMSGTDYSGENHDGAELTDSIMIISFDQDTGDADLISLPRDLKVDADCNYTGKINEVYYCNNLDGNNEEVGAEALANQISKILGLDLPYYAHVNWGSLKEIVDDLGGITVTLDEDIADYDYTGAVYDAGVPYTLDGEKAVGLSRARHGTEKGDFSRGASQQKILLGIKDRIISKRLSVPELISLANTLGDNLRTNFSVGNLKTLAHIATTIDWDNITEVSFLDPEPLLTDGMINGISYVYPTAGDGNFSEIRAYIKKLVSPNSSTPETTSDLTSENASIMIYNASGKPGAAAAEMSALSSTGLTNISVDDLIDAYFPAPYTLYSFTDSAPATTSALETQYNITASQAAPSYLPTTYDFILIIGG